METEYYTKEHEVVCTTEEMYGELPYDCSYPNAQTLVRRVSMVGHTNSQWKEKPKVACPPSTVRSTGQGVASELVFGRRTANLHILFSFSSFRLKVNNIKTSHLVDL